MKNTITKLMYLFVIIAPVITILFQIMMLINQYVVLVKLTKIILSTFATLWCFYYDDNSSKHLSKTSGAISLVPSSSLDLSEPSE